MSRLRFVVFLIIALQSFAFLSVAQESREPMEVKDLPGYDQLRDPFWPIGYARKVAVKVDPTGAQPQQQPEEKQEVKADWPKLKLKAVTTTPKGRIAIIDQIGLVEEGQIITRKVKDVIYTWRIDAISERGFSYTQVEAKPAK